MKRHQPIMAGTAGLTERTAGGATVRQKPTRPIVAGGGRWQTGSRRDCGERSQGAEIVGERPQGAAVTVARTADVVLRGSHRRREDRRRWQIHVEERLLRRQECWAEYLLGFFDVFNLKENNRI